MKFWITVGVLSVFLIVAGIFAFRTYNDLKEEREAHAQTQQQLNQALANQQRIEATVDVFRTTVSANQGTLFNPANVEVVPLPESLMNDSYITNPAELQGALWRIPVGENGLITYDMLVYEPLHPSERIHVVMVDSHTPSLIRGSYVDIRMITPEGIDYVVMPKMRVINLYTSGLEMRLSETQWMIYIGALIDKVMNPGTILYASMYVDPGLQPALYSTYIPPRHIVEYMNINRNMLFPYVDGTDIVEIRAFIESTFPANAYRHINYTSPEAALRERAETISRAVTSQSGAMNRARGEFVQAMRDMAQAEGQTWTGASTGTSQYDTPNVQQGQVGQSSVNTGANIQAGGTWIDSQGIERYPDGTPVIQVGDLFNTGTPNQQYQAPLNTGTTDNQGSIIPNLGGGNQ